MSERILSSTAERTYWLGRYLERASNTARLVSVNADLLIDLPMRTPLGWLPLVEILALEEEYEALYGPSEDQAEGDTNEKSVVKFLLSDRRNRYSLMSSLDFAKENARTLRGTLPRDAFEHINAAVLYAKDAFSEPLSRTRRVNGLQHIIERLQQIDGFLSQTMLHGSGWDFLRLGNFIERADMTTRIIDLRTTELLAGGSQSEAFESIQWRSMLESLDATQGYTVAVQSPISQDEVLPFLLQHPDLPRSLLRCYRVMRNCLRSLPNSKEPLAQVTMMYRQLQRARVRTLTGDRLHRYIDARQKQLDTLHTRIQNAYFP